MADFEMLVMEFRAEIDRLLNGRFVTPSPFPANCPVNWLLALLSVSAFE